MGARRTDLERIFSIQPERRINGDKTIVLDNRVWQIEKTRWRKTLAGCQVMVYEHLDGLMLVRFGPHAVARFAPTSCSHELEVGQAISSCRVSTLLLRQVEKLRVVDRLGCLHQPIQRLGRLLSA